MAFTTPRTWVVGEVVTAALGNTHWKDNLRYLKGLDGVPTIESGLIIDNTGGDEYLQIPSLTTVERDALTPVNGMVIYNETTNEFNKYENAGWKDLGGGVDHGGLDGLGDDDHTIYQKEDLLTTQGDIPYATAASTWARLAKGTGGQFLKMNSGATAPEWGTSAEVGEGHILIFGHNYSAIGQGTWVYAMDVNVLFGGSWRNSSVADADNISYQVYLAAGTYTVRLLATKQAASGILDIDIDAAEVASFDLYSASDDYNQISSQTNIAVATAGLKTLKLRLDGKNASSSDYNCYLICIALWRTA